MMIEKSTLIKQIAVLMLLVVIAVIIILVINYFSLPQIKPNAKMITITIPKRASVDAICDTLLNKKLIEEKELFKFWLTTLEKDRALKAGKFEIPSGLNYAQLVRYLTQAQAKEIKVTLLEGWQITDVARRLSTDLGTDSATFVSICHDSSFLRENGLTVSSAEGYLLPDTYYFYWGMSEKEIAGHLIKHTLSLFTDSIKTQLTALSMSIHEIITLASIIEGEAIYDDERATISSVFHNRLKKGIKLQADPTIQYILKDPPRRLLYKDLRIDSPYNTYMYHGLPPGPINNPGKNSIMAAIFPEDTNFLYFVARGDGRHTFTRTATEHSREKAKFNKIRRELYLHKTR
jgi:UPF0755 protein